MPLEIDKSFLYDAFTKVEYVHLLTSGQIEILKEKLLVDGVSPDDVSMVTEPTFENLTKLAATYSDGLVQGSEILPDSVLKVMKDSAKPTLNYVPGTEYVDAFSVFYDSILND